MQNLTFTVTPAQMMGIKTRLYADRFLIVRPARVGLNPEPSICPWALLSYPVVLECSAVSISGHGFEATLDYQEPVLTVIVRDHPFFVTRDMIESWIRKELA